MAGTKRMLLAASVQRPGLTLDTKLPARSAGFVQAQGRRSECPWRWPLRRDIQHSDKFGVPEATNKGISPLLLAHGPIEEALIPAARATGCAVPSTVCSAQHSVIRLAMFLVRPPDVTLL